MGLLGDEGGTGLRSSQNGNKTLDAGDFSQLLVAQLEHGRKMTAMTGGESLSQLGLVLSSADNKINGSGVHFTARNEKSGELGARV